MKKNKFIIFAFILISNFLTANNIDYTKSIGELTVNFKANNSNKIYNSELSILDKNKVLVYNTNFSNDENIKNFKFVNNNKIIELSKTKSSISKELSSSITLAMDSFLESILKDLKEEDENIAQLWFHYSVLKINERFLENNICECTVHPAYLIGKTNFNCLEDHKLSTILLKKELKTNKDYYNDENSKKLISFLETNIKETITFKEVYNYYYSIIQYKKDIQTNSAGRTAPCLLGSGSSHGCCGNYSGCCYYVNPLCHIHDAMCSDCKPRWFCLSGCIPD